MLLGMSQALGPPPSYCPHMSPLWRPPPSPFLGDVLNGCSLTGARKYDHISPVLRDLHWLPLRQRIIFKIASLMHQCLNGLAPSYLATDCIAISSMPGRRQLRSATSGQLYIPRTKKMIFGPRSFMVSSHNLE